MLKKYINGTRKKLVATSLALITTFSAVATSPNYHSYNSNLLQVNATKLEHSHEYDVEDLKDEQDELISELKILKQREADACVIAKNMLDTAIHDLKRGREKIYKKSKNPIQLADNFKSLTKNLKSVKRTLGRDEFDGDLIFQTLVDTFTDDSKELIDEIYNKMREKDSSKSFNESKQLVDVFISNFSEMNDDKKIETIASSLFDSENRKSEIENRIIEIELQILDEIGLQKEDDDTSKSLAEILANMLYKSETNLSSIEKEYTTAKTNFDEISDKYDKDMKPAKDKLEIALKNYENARNNYQTVNLDNNDYTIICDTLINAFTDAIDKLNIARTEYFNTKTKVDDKYNADLVKAKSEFLRVEEIMSDYSDILSEICEEADFCLENDIISKQEFRSALLALGYSKEELDEMTFFVNI